MQNKTIGDSLYPLRTKALRETLMELERTSVLRNTHCDPEISEMRDRILSLHKRSLQSGLLVLSSVILALSFLSILIYISF